MEFLHKFTEDFFIDLPISFNMNLNFLKIFKEVLECYVLVKCNAFLLIGNYAFNTFNILIVLVEWHRDQHRFAKVLHCDLLFHFFVFVVFGVLGEFIVPKGLLYFISYLLNAF